MDKLLINNIWIRVRERFSKIRLKEELLRFKKSSNFNSGVLSLLLILMILAHGRQVIQTVDPLISPLLPLHPLTQDESVRSKSGKEVFGFAPFWNFGKLDNIDFNSLTTLAYFGIPVNADGTLDRQDKGYEVFTSRDATQLFKNAHLHGTRVVLTLTQMQNDPILTLMDGPDGQRVAIDEAVGEVQKRGIDGINVDFEYSGDPGREYRDKFSQFIKDLTGAMHARNPNSKVTVSVYAASVKDAKIYDIHTLARSCDGIFMMAYDFAVAGSDNAIPTAPLYGHRQGAYWYDVSSAVEDFLTQMPAEKLILGVPWYGYNYLVYEPAVKAETRPWYSWRGRPTAQPYSIALDNIKPDMEDIADFKTGWDDLGKVAWKAYYVASTNTWRMLFLDDPKSFAIKIDFAKEKNLGGVGMWALGFDAGRRDFWNVLRDKLGTKFADAAVVKRDIMTVENN